MTKKLIITAKPDKNMKRANGQYNTHLIFGLGQSGLSCARYFDRIQQHYSLVDTRKNPPGEKELDKLKYCESCYFGIVDHSVLKNCQKLIVSPGIALSHPLVVAAKRLGVDVCGDVEIFARACNKKIVAITGSNGKSTVTDLTDKLISAAKINSQKGGNIGLPVLDFLPEDVADIYVLELSSFQLDTTESLRPEVAVLLNISEDHMDRYSDFKHYQRSKQQIFRHAKYRIFNQDDDLTYPQKIVNEDIGFSIKQPNNASDCTINYVHKSLTGLELTVNDNNIISTDSLKITGNHNFANVLASFSILSLLGVKLDQQVLSQLESYHGLAHRFQLISRTEGCEWINDSKATNVGATIAALESVNLVDRDQLILIAGGDSKQSDLKPLIKPIEEKVSAMILLGKDAKLFALLSSKITSYLVENMHQAVSKARQLIEGKSVVLLSPACSSLDMYKNFEQRGNEFIDAVRAVT